MNKKILLMLNFCVGSTLKPDIYRAVYFLPNIKGRTVPMDMTDVFVRNVPTRKFNMHEGSTG